jgi:phosphoketolase
MHFNRLIKKDELDALFISGPGHGAPAVLSQSYLEGVYSEVYPDKTEDEEGTDDRPIIFNFHSYPWLVHRLTYKRPGQENIHVRGYREKGNIDTPLELAIRNQTDRYSLAMDAIDRIKGLHNTASSVREKLLHLQMKAKASAFENGIDPVEIRDWTWPFGHWEVAKRFSGEPFKVELGQTE